MLLPIKWAKEYVDIDNYIMDICDKVTLTGSHVESIEKLGTNIKNIVIGKILEIYRHENSKKLWITKVDIGNEIVQIVTAAQNLQQFDYVPVAKVNSTLADNTQIKEAKLAGEISQGMFCSYKELGYPDSVIPKEYKDGVLRIFDENIVLGTDIREILDLDDTVVEFEITPNRPDCLSIVGMSREIAASFNKKLNEINIKDLKNINNSSSLLEINISSDNCKRYSASIIKDVKIEESNRKMQNYLLNSGIRPINNIVDLTNFLMLELGQPLHAFDLDKLEGNITIRNAFEGEKVVTLDDIERTLSSDDMLICDDVKPIAIAGVMGLKNSEIDSNTKNIFPEIFVLIFVRNPYNFDIYNLTFSDYGLLFHILIRVCRADFLCCGRTKNEIFEPAARRKHQTRIPRTRLQKSAATPYCVVAHTGDDDNFFISNFCKL